MAEKLKVREPIIVEGRYDKITLSNILDAQILTTDGFSVFKNEEKRALLRRIAEPRGVIVLTDSDGGGKQIRSFLSTLLPKEKVKHLYVPCVEGKEKRKKSRSRAGLLGVEGIDTETLRALFLPFAVDAPAPVRGRAVTKTDLYEHGLLGSDGATEKRAALCRHLSLPPLSSNALLETLNLLGDYDSFLRALEDCREL
jgi:ribonuclease M5